MVLSAVCLISDLFGKGDLMLGLAYFSPVLALPCQVNQILVSSRPNNHAVSVQ